MQNETVVEYKLLNKPSWVDYTAPLDGLIVLTIDRNLKRSGTYNLQLEMVRNETTEEFQNLDFTLEVFREKDWTLDNDDNLYRLRLQGVQKVSDY